MIRIYEDNIKIPACPKTAKPHNWKSKRVTKICDDGLELTFEVLTSKSSAAAFICDCLHNYYFPMAKPDWLLRGFQDDPEYYKEEMLNWEEDFNNYYYNSDVMTFCDFNGTDIVIEEDGLKGAITAFKKAGTVSSLCQSTGWDMTLYNGYIYYNEERGDWEGSLDLPPGVDFDDYEWENINGTYVEILNK